MSDATATTDALRSFLDAVHRLDAVREDGKLAVYRHAFDLADLLAAGWPRNTPAATAAMAELDRQWTEATGLDPLDTADAWRQAAIRAGYNGPTLDATRWPRIVEAVEDWFQSVTRTGQAITPPRRCRLSVAEGAATIDGEPFKVTPTQARGLQLLIEADGEYVNMTGSGIKPQRLQDGLPDKVLALIDTCSAGTRLAKEAWQT